jgi:integrase
MYSEGQEKAKVGRVQVDTKGKSYRLRFTYPEGNRHEFLIARKSHEGWTTAIRAAQLINRDIDLGDFDDTYARYSPKHAKRLQISIEEASKKYNLLELWERYEALNRDRIAKTTQKSMWSSFKKNWLEGTTSENLLLANADKFVASIIKRYSPSSIRAYFATCLHPCVNQAVEAGLIERNPYLKIPLPVTKKSKPKAFTSNEVKEIIDAFYGNLAASSNARFERSFYAPMVEFLALTGCRPEEAHALTWKDIKSNDLPLIAFTKAYSKGILLPHTKNHKIRIFRGNEQLARLISSISRKDDNELVFPSVEGTYMNQCNFNRRHWKPVVNELVKQGKVNEYLKPYCLRHSFITRLVRAGMDIATVAAISGNTVQVIMSNYLASEDDYMLPEL